MNVHKTHHNRVWNILHGLPFHVWKLHVVLLQLISKLLPKISPMYQTFNINATYNKYLIFFFTRLFFFLSLLTVIQHLHRFMMISPLYVLSPSSGQQYDPSLCDLLWSVCGLWNDRRRKSLTQWLEWPEFVTINLHWVPLTASNLTSSL